MLSKNQWIAIGLAVLGSLTVLISTLIIASGSFYIKNLGSSTLQNDKLLNTLSVDGEGRVFAKPDMVSISISVSKVAGTSKEAIESVNERINQAKQTALSNGVEDKDIQTSNFSIYTEYDYTGNERKVIGQRATVSLSIKVRGVDESAEKATKVIDELTKVADIEMSGINFDIEDKTPYFTQARELAFKKAEQKAKELALYSGIKLLSPVSIVEGSSGDITPPVFAKNEGVAMDSASVSANISSGQLELSISLSVIWGIE